MKSTASRAPGAADGSVTFQSGGLSFVLSDTSSFLASLPLSGLVVVHPQMMSQSHRHAQPLRVLLGKSLTGCRAHEFHGDVRVTSSPILNKHYLHRMRTLTNLLRIAELERAVRTYRCT